MTKLFVNIDHIATVRNARGEGFPCLLRAAKILELETEASGITVHLREDRRHIKDEDLLNLKRESGLPINLEVANTEEMIGIAVSAAPYMVCIVPEKRSEVTTEGGLNVSDYINSIKVSVKRLQSAGIKVSLFIEPDERQVYAAKECGADIVEFHTGKYSNLKGRGLLGESTPEEFLEELSRIQRCCKTASTLGLECHAGHGLNYDNVMDISKISQVSTLNIGHFLVGESIFIGLASAVGKMIEAVGGA